MDSLLESELLRRRLHPGTDCLAVGCEKEEKRRVIIQVSVKKKSMELLTTLFALIYIILQLKHQMNSTNSLLLVCLLSMLSHSASYGFRSRANVSMQALKCFMKSYTWKVFFLFSLCYQIGTLLQVLKTRSYFVVITRTSCELPRAFALA